MRIHSKRMPMTFILVLLMVNSIFAQLPKHVLQYVKQNFPNSVFPTHSQFSNYWEHFAAKDATNDPWYIIADFTGDGSTDFAIMIIDSSHTKYIAINSDGGHLNHHELFPSNKMHDDKELYTCILKREPGIITETSAGPGNPIPKVMHAIRPGIEVVFFERSSIYLCWVENKYEKLWTSD